MRTSKITQEERLLAIKMWRESGLSQGAFCKQEGISRSTFQHWRRRLDPTYVKMTTSKSKNKKVTPAFFPVEISAKDSSSSKVSTLEIQYPNGVKIICRENIEISKLQTLIQIV